MKRAENNYWAVVIGLILISDVIPVVLFLKTESSIAWGATVVIAIAQFFVARRLTCSRRWWVAPLVGSPFVLGPFVLGIAFLLALVGVIPVP